MQNTPKNYLTVADALILVCGSGNDAHEMLHEDILNTLPQLICTAFVPQNDSKPSCGLLAIEARVIVWLAKRWNLTIIKNNPKNKQGTLQNHNVECRGLLLFLVKLAIIKPMLFIYNSKVEYLSSIADNQTKRATVAPNCGIVLKS